MHFSPAQMQALKAAIAAAPDLASEPMNIDGAIAIQTKLLQNASPDFYTWKAQVTRAEIMTDPGFAWVQVDNLVVGKARIWEWMFEDGPIDPTRQNIRDGIAACWTGNAQMVAVQNAVLALCKRKMNRGEKIFADTSGGDGSAATPAKFGLDLNGAHIIGSIDPNHIKEARDLP